MTIPVTDTKDLTKLLSSVQGDIQRQLNVQRRLRKEIEQNKKNIARLRTDLIALTARVAILEST